MASKGTILLDSDNEGLVVVVATGGTIAQNGKRTASVDVETLLEASGVEGPIQPVQLLQVTSPNIKPEHWLMLASFLHSVAERPDVTGIAITHGTDTLEETAFFLDLTCRTDKPIILVGAMRPSNSTESDGEENLRLAITLARSRQARSKGVLTVLSGRVQAARDVTKRHSVKIDAFESPHLGDVGTIGRQGLRVARTLPALPFFTLPRELPEVPIIYGYAGLDVDALAYIVATKPAGLVMAGTGAGSIPDALQPFLTSLASDGCRVVRSSRTGAGSVVRNAEVDDDAAGFVAAGSLNPQKARVLLMLCIAEKLDQTQTQAMFDRCSDASQSPLEWVA